jgi:hypothetical protein
MRILTVLAVLAAALVPGLAAADAVIEDTPQASYARAAQQRLVQTDRKPVSGDASLSQFNVLEKTTNFGSAVLPDYSRSIQSPGDGGAGAGAGAGSGSGSSGSSAR